MNVPKTARFGDVRDRTRKVLRQHATLLAGREVVVVRDLDGRVRLALTGPALSEPDRTSVISSLAAELGPYAADPESTILLQKDMVEPDLIWASMDRHPMFDLNGVTAHMIDRQIVGHDWLRESATGRDSRRIVFHGIKGGVGRSTALSMVARALAEQGKNVIVLDLDLESPGVSVSLLKPEELPDVGLVDYFVESAIDVTARQELLASMLVRGALDTGSSGQIRVISAFGAGEREYVPKLSRCYNELRDGIKVRGFAERVEEFIEFIEQQEAPDVVLIDSRAGIDDIAACTLGRLGGTNLLFGTSGRQTWQAYRLLFEHLAGRRDREQFLARTKVVAALLPEVGRERYLNLLTQRAYDAFLNSLYVGAAGGEVAESSFDLAHEEAPHFPLKVLWNRAYLEFDATDASQWADLLDPANVKSVYGDLIDYIRELTEGSHAVDD